MTIRLYTDHFNFVAPPKGWETILPHKVVFRLVDPDDELFLDIKTEFDLESLSLAIREMLSELSTELPDDEAPELHPDIVAMKIAYQILETKQNPSTYLSDLGLTRNIG